MNLFWACTVCLPVCLSCFMVTELLYQKSSLTNKAELLLFLFYLTWVMFSLKAFNLTSVPNNSSCGNRTQTDTQCLYVTSGNLCDSLSCVCGIPVWAIIPEIWSSEISSFPVKFLIQTVELLHCVTNNRLELCMGANRWQELVAEEGNIKTKKVLNCACYVLTYILK